MTVESYYTLKQVVCKVIDELPEGREFFAWELKDFCVAECPELKEKFVESFLKTMRMNRRDSVICIHHGKSKYRKVNPEIGCLRRKA